MKEILNTPTYDFETLGESVNILPWSDVVPYGSNSKTTHLGRDCIETTLDYSVRTHTWNMVDSEKYTMSIDVCSNIDTTFQKNTFYINSDTTPRHNSPPITTDWTTIEVSFVYNETGSTEVLHLYWNKPEGSKLYLSNFNLHKGDKLYPYAPNPDDFVGESKYRHVRVVDNTPITLEEPTHDEPELLI